MVFLVYSVMSFLVFFWSSVIPDARYDSDEGLVRGVFWPIVAGSMFRTGFKKFLSSMRNDNPAKIPECGYPSCPHHGR